MGWLGRLAGDFLYVLTVLWLLWGLLHKIVCFETYLQVGTNLEVRTFCITKFASINVTTPQICTPTETNYFMQQAPEDDVK